jgi:uncharacterized protein (DUF934 family)
MAVLERDRLIENPWVRVADDAPLPDETPALVSMKRLTEAAPDIATRTAPLGVLVTSDTRVETLEPVLGRIRLVAIDFPKYRDGRGFSIARTLRERYQFTGEIRAVGSPLPDQYEFLLRCGFTSVELPEAHADPKLWTDALTLVTIGYQAAVTKDTPLSGLRRRLAEARR